MAKNPLSQSWQIGDPHAFDELYSEYAQSIYRLGWAMLQDAQLAEDVVQETFLRAYKARERFDPERASIGTWLYQIGLNYCRSYLRRKRFLTISWLDNPKLSPLMRDPKAGPENALIKIEDQKTVWRVVEKLSPRLKEVIMLHYYLDIPAVEIADILNCPDGTIYSRLYHARRRLAKMLAKEGFTFADLFEVQNVS